MRPRWSARPVLVTRLITFLLVFCRQHDARCLDGIGEHLDFGLASRRRCTG